MKYAHGEDTSLYAHLNNCSSISVDTLDGNKSTHRIHRMQLYLLSKVKIKLTDIQNSQKRVFLL